MVIKSVTDGVMVPDMGGVEWFYGVMRGVMGGVMMELYTVVTIVLNGFLTQILTIQLFINDTYLFYTY